MQHVKPKWLRNLNFILVGCDILLIGAYLWMTQFGGPSTIQTIWGVDPLIFSIATIHLVYSLTIYPRLNKSHTWVANFGSHMLYSYLFAAIIETSGNVFLPYRLGFVVFIFLVGANGNFEAIGLALVTWLILLFTVTDVIGATNASIPFNIVIDTLMTLSAAGGLLFWRRYYVNKRTQEEIALANMLKQERFKSNVIIEAITDGVVIVNVQGKIELANRAAAEMLGWTQEEILKQDYQHTIVPMALPNEEKAIETAIGTSLRSGKASQRLSLLQTHNDHHIYVDIAAAPILQSPDSFVAKQPPKTIGTIAVLRNVDKQQRSEQQRTDFIMTASHEMRTPLTAMQGFIDLSLNPKTATIDERGQGYLEKARDTGKQLSKLFQNLLTIASGEEGKLDMTLQTIDAHELVQAVTTEAQSMATAKGLQLFSSNHPEQLYVNADRSQLHDALMNILENAVKYTASGGITISTSADAQKVVISIADTGAGIAQEDLPHLFEKFYRADNSSTREVGGPGLGLYVCKEIVEGMGGRISVQSTVGKGSTFSITLPRTAVPVLTTPPITQ